MYNNGYNLSDFDPELTRAIADEKIRQEEHIELIASENYASPRVMAAQGSVLTNKYAEGYPGRRYYGGCEHVDVAEQLAQDRARELFGCGFTFRGPFSRSVSPRSGSRGNGNQPLQPFELELP